MKFYQLFFKKAEEAHKSCIGIIGGGGKTALLHTLGNEFSHTFSRVILSSLTKSGVSKEHPAHLYQDLKADDSTIKGHKINPLYIMEKYEHENKLLGLNEIRLKYLYQISDLTVFECDGARKRSIKAHQPHDPKIPRFATHAVIVVGADAVGATVDVVVHRPQLFRKLWNVNGDYKLEPGFIAHVVTGKKGYLQKIPRGIKLAYLVNKADVFPGNANKLGKAIASVTKSPVFICSLKHEQLERIH